ncbi:MAG TPA: PAS domain-containing protein, partial [Caulifigura sp.]|nr:PAS domain-containing protein [Caulifigura sp.]
MAIDLLRVAAEAVGADQFLEDVADILFRGLATEGVSIRSGDNPSTTELIAAIGDVRSLDRPVRSGDAQASAWLNVELSSATATAELALGSRRIVIGVSFTPDPEADGLDGAWLHQILAHPFSLFDTIHSAREAATISSALIREGTDAIIGLAADGACRLWNPAAERHFGWPEEEVLGRPLPIIPAEQRRPWMELIASADASGRTSRSLLTARRWDGSTADVEAQVIPLCST